MNRIVVILLLAFLLNSTSDIFAYDTLKYVRKGYILNLVDKEKSLGGEVLENLIDTYFTVYPVLVRNFNEDAVRKVVYYIDPTYDGIAESDRNRIIINPQWLRDHPDDFDIITHEVMHLVQDYPPGTGPWWITEGIADYVRYVYGVDNEKGGWFLPDYSREQSYNDGYRVTARFFLWIEKRVRPGFIKQLDHAMRANIYSDRFWGQQTGMTLDELWDAYGQNPVF